MNCKYERPQDTHYNNVQTIVFPEFTEQTFISLCKAHNENHHSSVPYVAHSSLPEYYAVSIGKILPTFRRTVVPSSSCSRRVMSYWAAWPCCEA